MSEPKMKTFVVTRFDPDQDEAPRKQSYEVPVEDGWKVLDALKGKPKASVSGGSFTWCWCDALFMSPAVWVHLSEITGDPKYLKWADREWWTCTDVLYDPEACLYYRDNNFFKKRTPSGRKVFWSRGNGWVLGGIPRVLQYLPKENERYDIAWWSRAPKQ